MRPAPATAQQNRSKVYKPRPRSRPSAEIHPHGAAPRSRPFCQAAQALIRLLAASDSRSHIAFGFERMQQLAAFGTGAACVEISRAWSASSCAFEVEQRGHFIEMAHLFLPAAPRAQRSCRFLPAHRAIDAARATATHRQMRGARPACQQFRHSSFPRNNARPAPSARGLAVSAAQCGLLCCCARLANAQAGSDPDVPAAMSSRSPVSRSCRMRRRRSMSQQ